MIYLKFSNPATRESFQRAWAALPKKCWVFGSDNGGLLVGPSTMNDVRTELQQHSELYPNATVILNMLGTHTEE